MRHAAEQILLGYAVHGGYLELFVGQYVFSPRTGVTVTVALRGNDALLLAVPGHLPLTWLPPVAQHLI
jgi:hypothetical protein